MRGSTTRAIVLAGVVACGARAPKFEVHESEKRGRLDANGLRFVIMPDASTSLVEVAVRYEVGAADDPPGKSGLAHLVEHLVFDTRPDGETGRSLSYYLDQVASRWNAYTDYDATHYMTLAPARAVDTLIELEAMRLYYGCEGITDDEFAREREVVRNELRQREGTPEGAVGPLLEGMIYPADHPYHHDIGGTDAELTSITRDETCAFIASHYVPSRATVIVAGNVDADAAARSVGKWFGPVPARTAAPRTKVPEFALPTERREIAVDLERPIVAVSWQLPASTTTADQAVVAEMASRMAWLESAAAEYGFATRVGATTLGGHGSPVFTVLLEVNGDDDVDTAVDFVWKAAGHDSRYVDSPAIKSRMKTRYVMRLEPLEIRANLVADQVQYGSGVEFLSNASYVFHGLDEIEALDLGDVIATAKRRLSKANAQITVFRANRGGVKSDPQSSFALAALEHQLPQPDVDPAEAKRPIDLGPRTPGLVAGAERLELDNGLHVVLLPLANAPLPVVTAQIVIGAGDAATPDAPGIASATAQFALAPNSYLVQMSRAGVRIGCSTTLDDTLCTAEGINVYLHETIEGIERTLRMGSFDQKLIEQEATRQHALAKRRRQRVLDEVEREELIAIYGADHPYTRSAIPSAVMTSKFGRDDLLAFRAKHYGAANTTVILAGAFDRDRALSIIKATFGGWPRGTVDAAIATPPAPRTGPAYVGVIREARPQVDLSIAYPSPAGIGGQQAARLVVTQMLSDEAWQLRDKLGLTYGTSARRLTRRGPTMYEVQGAVDTARAGEALSALRAGIDALRTGDDFDVRFVRARRRVVQRLQGEDTGSYALAGRLAQIAQFGLAANYYDQLITQVAALSKRQVQDMIAAELAPEGETVVASADRDTLVAAFTAAGITDYTLIEPVADDK